MVWRLGRLLYGALALVVWPASASEKRAIRRLERQNEELTLLQQFTQSVLRPLDFAQVAASVVESAGTALHLSAAAIYRASSPPGHQAPRCPGPPPG